MPVTKDEMIKGLMAPMVETFEAKGITKELLAEKLMDELEAGRVESYRAKVVKKVWNAEKKRFEDVMDTTVIYSVPIPEWDVRQKARIDAHRLRGDYPPEEKRISGADGSPLIPGDARPIRIEFVKSNVEGKK
jgi:hypothetical protein